MLAPPSLRQETRVVGRHRDDGVIPDVGTSEVLGGNTRRYLADCVVGPAG